MRIVTEKLAHIPTPLAGLALGIASLGICIDTCLNPSTSLQSISCIFSVMLLISLAFRFLIHPMTLWQDLKHPVVGSVIPTFTMACMLVSLGLSKTSLFGEQTDNIAQAIWMLSVFLHLGFLMAFIYHLLPDFSLDKMVPSWFVPPVGIIVAAVSFQGVQGSFSYYLAHFCLYLGLISYSLLLPVMFYRLIFRETILDPAKPTIAILAAPASLSLVGYLTLIEQPNMLVVFILLGIALLMTGIIYTAFLKLLTLPFTPAYASFTFPMAIGVTALYKTAEQFKLWALPSEISEQITYLAHIELIIAVVVISYVTLKFANHFLITLQKPAL